MKYAILLVVMVCGSQMVGAQESYSLNRNWKFFTYSEDDSSIVNLPHQWNSDALAGRLDYYRGTGNYLRYVDFKSEWRGKRIFIRFGGANLVTDVLINGRYVGRHEGGSNAFVFDITDFVNFNGRDLLWVIVNNGSQTNVMPTAGNEISYGGLFREVEIFVEEPTHIAIDHYASKGVYVHTKSLSESEVRGEVEVKVRAQNQQSASVTLKIRNSAGREVFSTSQRVRTSKGTVSAYVPFTIEQPELWNGLDNPALYSVEVSLTSAGEKRDEAVVETGFRKIEIGVNGVLLNGREYPIKGVVMHRDRALRGSAVTDREVLEDVEFAREMGANAIRVVGGTHHPSFYRICDQQGILVINDLPLMGATTLNGKGFFNTEAFRNNGKEQLQEMIYQNYNSPSVVAWNLFSELEVRGENPVAYIRELHSLAKRIDPGRYTVGWSNQDGDINFVTDLVVWSHNLGWMEGNPEDISVWQEQLHSVPEWRALRSAVSYKCGGNIFHHSDLLEKPLTSSSWHPERWQTHFHETYLRALEDDSLFWGIFVDGLFDYASVDTHRSAGGVCDMGVVSFNRQARKDAFYLYKSVWNNNDEFLHIAERRWGTRTDTLQNIKVYTNLPDVDLSVNGAFVSTKEGANGVIEWDGVVLQKGSNLIEATSRGVTDRVAIEIPFSHSDEL